MPRLALQRKVFFALAALLVALLLIFAGLTRFGLQRGLGPYVAEIELSRRHWVGERAERNCARAGNWDALRDGGHPYAQHPRAVEARVKAVLRRSGADLAASNAAATGSLLLDDGQWRVTLQLQLLELAYDDVLDVNERAIDRHVKHLRRELATAAPDHGWLRSVHGIGFAFEDVDARA